MPVGTASCPSDGCVTPIAFPLNVCSNIVSSNLRMRYIVSYIHRSFCLVIRMIGFPVLWYVFGVAVWCHLDCLVFGVIT